MQNFRPNAVQANINVDINQLETMQCQCKNRVFIKLYQLKHISAFYTQTGKATGVETLLYVCTNPACGLMVAGAMDQADMKRVARDPETPRFNWVDFFRSGLLMVAEDSKTKQAAASAEVSGNGKG